MSAHRSIRLARMFGFAANLLAVLCLILGCGRYTIGFFLVGGIGLARAGDALSTGCCHQFCLRRLPPTDAEIAAASNAGLYCAAGAKDFANSVVAEYALALILLHSLAPTATR